MPSITNSTLSIAFDIHGCPQNCRHCWLGPQKPGNMTFKEATEVFFHIKEEQKNTKHFDIQIEYFGPDFREPHFGNDYKNEYAEADRINGTRYDIDHDFELVSLWRLTRDKEYAPWCKARGIHKAQLKCFGSKEADDFFLGRTGAHEETLRATRILLENGIVPRFQIYLNKTGIGSLHGFLDELEKTGITGRIAGKPDIHCLPFDAAGNGFINREYRIDINEAALVPDWLKKSTETHFGRPFGLFSEKELAESILAKEDGPVNRTNPWPWLFVDKAWDVYPNAYGLYETMKLGNLKQDAWHRILKAYVLDETSGLQILKSATRHALVKKHHTGPGNSAFVSEDDLQDYYLTHELID